MPRLLRVLTAGAIAASGLAGLVHQAPQASAVAGMRVSMIGDALLVSLMNASLPVRATIMASYPNTNIDGTACRGSVRSSCQGAPPAKGLPASTFDVIKANSGSLGDAVVLVIGYSDLVSSPSSTPPDLAPFNTDFEAIMNALNGEASVQRVIVLNLRTEDARIPNVPANNQRNKYIAINSRLVQYDALNAVYPKLQVWDWNASAAGLNCGPDDDACFQADGITPRVNNPGAQAYANFIKFALDNTSGTPTNPVDPLPSGNRCLPGNGTGFLPWSYVGLAPGYPPAPPAPQTPDPARFRSIDPVRLLDSRVGDGDAANRMLLGGRLLRLRVVGDNLPGGTVVPPSAASVSLNVTVAGACASGFVAVFPCGPTAPPVVSNLNFQPGQIVPNAVTTRVGTLGRVCLYTNVQTDLIVDINGYYDGNLTAANVSGHAGTAPARVVDTRPGTTSLDAGKVKVNGNTSRLVNLVGLGAVPAGTTGVVLNVTSTESEGSGFLTVFPASGGGCTNRPIASNVNYLAGQNVANYVAVRVPGNGQICVYALARTHIVLDRVATFGAAGTNLRSVNPVRIVDTRAGQTAKLNAIKGRLQPMVPIVVNVGAAGVGLPGGADAVILNVTAVTPSGSGFVSVYPCGPWPGTSSLNYAGNDIRPNQVDATLSGGQVCVLSLVPTDVVIDLMGWYQS